MKKEKFYVTAILPTKEDTEITWLDTATIKEEMHHCRGQYAYEIVRNDNTQIATKRISHLHQILDQTNY